MAGITRKGGQVNAEPQPLPSSESRQIVFLDRAIPASEGAVTVDLRSPDMRSTQELSKEDLLDRILADKSGPWLDALMRWIGALNCQNASLGWWAYTSTAKNLLSSPLGMKVLETLATAELARVDTVGNLQIVGASAGQRDALRRLLSGSGITVSDRTGVRARFAGEVARLRAAARLLHQAARAWTGFLFTPTHRPKALPDLCLVTYVDAPPQADNDAYFGALPELLDAMRRGLGCLYVPYVYTPYRARLQAFRQATGRDVAPLFGFLGVLDHLWALARSLRELTNFKYSVASSDPMCAALSPLLREALVDDLAAGGYLHNLLVFRATRGMVRRLNPRMLVYPYENKSLEKALLLGARDANGSAQASRTPRIVAYQHTSVTPRHRSLLFEPGEAAITPLPDCIITVGDVTRRWLERNGRYPQGIFRTGCALRQRWRKLLPFRNRWQDAPRVLLALSSSRAELIRAVEFLAKAKRSLAHIEIGVRPHPNFPLSVLPNALREWVGESALDLTGTLLDGNLEWCDVVAYVSSTVGLEGLMVGRPIIKLAVDPLDPDPLLEDVPMRWTATSPEQVFEILGDISLLGSDELERRRAATTDYLRTYFRPVSEQALEHFLPAR